MDWSPQGSFCLWDSPGKNTGVGCHFLLQGIFSTQGLNLHLPGKPRVQVRVSLKWQSCSNLLIYNRFPVTQENPNNSLFRVEESVGSPSAKQYFYL